MNLDFIQWHQRECDWDLLANVKAPARDTNDILKLILPQTFDDNVVCVFCVILRWSSNDDNLTRSNHAGSECAWSANCYLQTPADGSVRAHHCGRSHSWNTKGDGVGVRACRV